MLWQVYRYNEIGSTNEEALARIRRGEVSGGEVFVARIQTAGRGRHGREWRSDEGGLWLTAVLPALDPLAATGLAIGVAVCRYVAALGLAPRLKWPNDVEVSDRKLCGILVEHIAGQPFLAAGIGLNVANPVESLADLRRPAVSLSGALGRPLAPEACLEPLLEALGAVWGLWTERGWPAILPEARAWDGSAGRPVRAADDSWEGTAQGLDDRGALLVRADDGSLRRVDAGEVDFSGAGC
jgi:BirA family biotin operon repressor/biotin-[acetyl-CoA-carboxylase] ligase